MVYLLVVSLLWAVSPGLIKGRLAGLDSALISVARLGLALLVFAPFLRFRRLPARTAWALTGIGALQFGVMYLAYNESFHFLPAYEVALFTITTPILVTLIADAIDQVLRPRALLAAGLAVIGTAVLVWHSTSTSAVTMRGFLLVQISNAAFAVGQVLYRRVQAWPGTPPDRETFALLYGGALAVSLAALLLKPEVSVTFTTSQLITLLYLGVISSGIGFFLWNRGATRVNAGTLAVMNNAKVPLMVACSLLFFGESADIPRMLVSLGLLSIAVWVAEKK